MIRLYKPARHKHNKRGLFSYFTESLINLTNFTYKNGSQDIKYYHDLFDIPGYTKGNLFDICFLQDEIDYYQNKDYYNNIEDIENFFSLYGHRVNKFTKEIRLISEKVVKEFFIPNNSLETILNNRFKEINFDNTIGVHRRATDMSMHHEIVDIQNIFLISDNSNDLELFKKRYGSRIITYEFNSEKSNLPYFKLEHSSEEIENHVREMVFGVFALSKTKKFICSKSNISSFSILANSNLIYKVLD